MTQTAAKTELNESRKKSRRMIAFSIAAICLAILGWRLFPHRDPLAEVPNEPTLATPWGCQSCGHVVLLTPRQRVELQNQTVKPSSTANTNDNPTPPPEEQTSLRELILRCPQCNQTAMHKALTCPKCNARFPRLVKGQPQKCPTCSFDPSNQITKKQRKPVSAREPVEQREPDPDDP